MSTIIVVWDGDSGGADELKQAPNLIYLILLHGKFLLFDLLRGVVFQFNLKYLHVKTTNLLWVVV